MRQKTKERRKAREAVSSLVKLKKFFASNQTKPNKLGGCAAIKRPPKLKFNMLDTDYHSGNHLGCIQANEGDFYCPLC